MIACFYEPYPKIDSFNKILFLLTDVTSHNQRLEEQKQKELTLHQIITSLIQGKKKEEKRRGFYLQNL